jgi:hypothetical protein
MPKESGTGIRDDDALSSVVHAIVSVASSLALNVELLVEKSAPCVDQALLDDTRSSLGRLVQLARELRDGLARDPENGEPPAVGVQ